MNRWRVLLAAVVVDEPPAVGIGTQLGGTQTWFAVHGVGQPEMLEKAMISANYDNEKQLSKQDLAKSVQNGFLCTFLNRGLCGDLWNEQNGP